MAIPLVDRLRAGIDLDGSNFRSSEDAMEEAAAEIERLRAALEQCAAEFSILPGDLVMALDEIRTEFARRMEIAGRALNGDG